MNPSFRDGLVNMQAADSMTVPRLPGSFKDRESLAALASGIYSFVSTL